MASPSYELTGSALYGVEPETLPRAALAQMAAGPVEVCLGANLSPDFDAVRAVPLADFFSAKLAVALPPSTNRREKAKASLSTMLGNNRYGNCVIAGFGHQVGVWTANDPDSGGEVVMAEQEAVSQYRTICGPGDNGCSIPAVLAYAKSKGITVAGRNHKIGDFVKIDWKNHDLVRAAIFALGGVKIGFRCPPQFLQNAEWKYYGPPVTRGPGAWGGHDAPPVDYTEDGPLSSSWGRVYQWSWQAWDSYVTECYAPLSADWYNVDGLAPSGLDVAGLKAALEALGRGEIPDGPAPGPNPPPSPPPPPGPAPAGDSYILSGTFTGTVRAVPQPDSVTIDCPHELHGRRLVEFAARHFGGSFEWSDGKLRGKRPSKLSPQQWANVVAAVIKVLTLIAELAPLFA